jgi:hypothetical protein
MNDVSHFLIIEIKTPTSEFLFEHIAVNGWALKISSVYIGRLSDDETVAYIKNIEDILSIKTTPL